MTIYSVSKSLVGGQPDMNFRTIYRHKDKSDLIGTPVCTFNREMNVWTKEMDLELRACLKGMAAYDENESA